MWSFAFVLWYMYTGTPACRYETDNPVCDNCLKAEVHWNHSPFSSFFYFLCLDKEKQICSTEEVFYLQEWLHQKILGTASKNTSNQTNSSMCKNYWNVFIEFVTPSETQKLELLYLSGSEWLQGLYQELLMWWAPSWFKSLMLRVLHWYLRGHGLKTGIFPAFFLQRLNQHTLSCCKLKCSEGELSLLRPDWLTFILFLWCRKVFAFISNKLILKYRMMEGRSRLNNMSYFMI